MPIRGIKEYRFVFGDNQRRSAPATATPSPGRWSARRRRTATGRGRAGDQLGVDYETDVTLDELIEIMFEDLELPDMDARSCAR